MVLVYTGCRQKTLSHTNISLTNNKLQTQTSGNFSHTHIYSYVTVEYQVLVNCKQKEKTKTMGIFCCHQKQAQHKLKIHASELIQYSVYCKAEWAVVYLQCFCLYKTTTHIHNFTSLSWLQIFKCWKICVIIYYINNTIPNRT